MNELEKNYINLSKQLQSQMITYNFLYDENVREGQALSEVKELGEEHKCYKAIGRAYFSVAQPKLKDNLVNNIKYLSQECDVNKKQQVDITQKLQRIQEEATKLQERERGNK